MISRDLSPSSAQHLRVEAFICFSVHLQCVREHLLKFTEFGRDSQGLESVRYNSMLKRVGQEKSLISIVPFNGEFGINSGLHKNPCRKKAYLHKKSIGEFIFH